MQVRALRGVCIGVERHLKPGDTVDLPAAEVQFLVGIGAVECLPDAPPAPKPEPEPEVIRPAAKPGKERK